VSRKAPRVRIPPSPPGQGGVRATHVVALPPLVLPASLHARRRQSLSKSSFIAHPCPFPPTRPLARGASMPTFVDLGCLRAPGDCHFVHRAQYCDKLISWKGIGPLCRPAFSYPLVQECRSEGCQLFSW
jgi:hypothetical protein